VRVRLEVRQGRERCTCHSEKGLGLGVEQAVGLDRPELKPREREAAARILGATLHPRKLSSVKEEAHPLGWEEVTCRWNII